MRIALVSEHASPLSKDLLFPSMDLLFPSMD